MAFQIVENPMFTLDVAVPMPDGSEQVLKTTFKGLSEEEFDLHDWQSRDGSKDGLRAIIDTFHEVEGADGKTAASVKRSHALYEALLSQPNVRVALQNAYARAMVGLKGPRRGN